MLHKSLHSKKPITDTDTTILSGYNPTQFFNKSIWRVAEVACYLGVSKGHIYNLCSRREIPFAKKGKLLYFIPKEIENWILLGD